MSYGQKSIVGITFQTSFGTAGSIDSAHYIPHLSESFQKKIPPLISESTRDIFDEGDTYEGAHTVEGELDAEAGMLGLGAMLKAVMNLDSSVNSGGIYTHTFTPRTSDFDNKSAGTPFTAHLDRDGGESLPYFDLNGNTLELSVANGEFLKTKLGVVGGQVGSGSSLTPAYSTGKKFTWDIASLDIASVAQDKFTDLTISLEESLEPMHTLDGNKFPNCIKRTGMRMVNVSGTMKFNDHTEYDQFISQSEREMIVHFEGNVEIQSGYNESLTMILPALRYEDAQANAGGAGQLELAITAKAKYNVGSANALKITLVNTQATY